MLDIITRFDETSDEHSMKNQSITNFHFDKMKHLIILFTTLTLLFGCSSQEKPILPHNEKNSVYYWKTTFALDSVDFAFIHRHNIERIYLRMFDVSVDDNGMANGDNTVPNATVKILGETYYRMQDSLASIEFNPVVYITLDALKDAKDREGRLAKNIVTRVKNMCSYNGLPNVKGLQLDCDWTISTEQSFFSLCDSVKIEICKQDLNWNLSSTIRLHQLARKTPPVDYGVLMVYNTGSFNDPDAINSILDEKDVKPYLKHLRNYPLHLDIAYPTYSWQLLFHKRQFVGLLNGVEVMDATKFQCGKDSCIYYCLEDLPYKKMVIKKGDVIRVETSQYKDIIRVKALIEKQLHDYTHSNVLYHFDLHNFTKYSDDEINNIFSVTSVK